MRLTSQEIPTIYIRRTSAVDIKDVVTWTNDGNDSVERVRGSVFIIKTAVPNHGASESLQKTHVLFGILIRDLKTEICIVSSTAPIDCATGVFPHDRHCALTVVIVGVEIRSIEDLTVLSQ